MRRKELGKRIKTVRKLKSLTQEDLAEWVDVDPSYIGHIENGRKNPTFKVLVKIAKALGLKIDELVSINPQTHKKL